MTQLCSVPLLQPRTRELTVVNLFSPSSSDYSEPFPILHFAARVMKMKLQSSIVLLLLLVTVWPPSASFDDQLVLGKPLSPSTTIISDDGAFALGFFSPSNSTTSASSRDRLYLDIWYNGITELTVVWVANRESPRRHHRPAIYASTLGPAFRQRFQPRPDRRRVV
ncbi:hypothetical protein ZWY2020_013525 [Hordeum vulgare]|nr:hypothetical protein ZWY2020_013525 [Hordeum vulgare]